MRDPDDLIQIWAETTWRLIDGLGFSSSPLARVVKEGPVAAAIRLPPGSRLPPGLLGLPHAYVQVETVLRTLPRPAEYRIALAAEHGLLDCARGLKRQADRAAALHMLRTTYCRRLSAVHRALAEHM